MELTLTQDPAQIPEYRIGQDDVLLGVAGGLLHSPEEPLVVRHGVVQGGFGELQRQEAQITAEGDAGVHQLLMELLKDGDLLRGAEIRHLHTAAVGGGDVRHLDDRVAADLGHTGKPPARGVLLRGDVAVDRGVQIAGGQPDPALAAHAVAGAGGINGHVGLPGHVEKLLSCVGGDNHGVAAFYHECNGKHRHTFLSGVYEKVGTYMDLSISGGMSFVKESVNFLAISQKAFGLWKKPALHPSLPGGEEAFCRLWG